MNFAIYELIIIIFILLSIILMLPIIISNLLRKDKLRISKNNKEFNFAILIPARDESQVIENLIFSIEKQSKKVNSKNVYIIVESKHDKTVAIAKSHHMNIIYRKDLTKKRKGYAIDDAIKEIIKKKLTFDAYFVFDADNILDKNFIKEMEKSYHRGYDICIGYRNCKNGNSSVLAASSAMNFSMINTLYNKEKLKYNLNLTISGTGFFIKGKILEQLGGFPFTSLTEDYELSLYANLHGLSTGYNENAIYYDEQPLKYSQSKIQRIRWIKGYIEARNKYIPLLKNNLKNNKHNYNSNLIEIIGIKPLLSLVFGVVIYLLLLITNIIYNIVYNISIISLTFKFAITLILFYIALFIFTAVLLIKEKENINLSFKIKLKLLLFNPIYMLTYIPCAIIAFFKKDVEWKKIEHIIKEVK